EMDLHRLVVPVSRPRLAQGLRRFPGNRVICSMSLQAGLAVVADRAGSPFRASPTAMRSKIMKRPMNTVVAGGVAGLAGVAGADAQFRLRDRIFGNDDDNVDIASAGNGGVATASANGGAVSI